MIYWSTTIPGRFPKTEALGDEKYNHRLYYTTTTDFKTFSATRLLYDKGFNVIDASIVRNGNQYIMFLKDETLKPSPQKNIRIATSRKPKKSYSSPGPAITGNYWAEGPTAIRFSNKWWLYFDKYTQHQYGALQSDDLQQWTDISSQVKFPEGARHGTVFMISRSEFNHLLQN